MARTKLRKNVKTGAINRANRKLYKLVRRVIRTKQRDSDGHILQVRTGRLSRNIRPVLSINDDNNLIVDMEMMEYYEWLDDGTRRIKPWNLSEEIMDSPEMEEIIEELYFEAFQDLIFTGVSKFNK